MQVFATAAITSVEPTRSSCGMPPPLLSVSTQRILPASTASASQLTLTWLSRPEKPPMATTLAPDVMRLLGGAVLAGDRDRPAAVPPGVGASPRRATGRCRRTSRRPPPAGAAGRGMPPDGRRASPAGPAGRPPTPGRRCRRRRRAARPAHAPAAHPRRPGRRPGTCRSSRGRASARPRSRGRAGANADRDGHGGRAHAGAGAGRQRDRGHGARRDEQRGTPAELARVVAEDDELGGDAGRRCASGAEDPRRACRPWRSAPAPAPTSAAVNGASSET